jgi:hypothetical protein
MLALEHENATLRAELASLASVRYSLSSHLPLLAGNLGCDDHVGTPVPAAADAAGAGAGSCAAAGPAASVGTADVLLEAVSDAVRRLLHLGQSTSAPLPPWDGSGSPSVAGIESPQGGASVVAARLADAVQRVVQEHVTLASSADRLSAEVAALQGLRDRISFREFGPGDVALFFPMAPDKSLPASAPQRRLYVAFNERAPNNFLSEESTAAFRAPGGVYPAFVVGRIVAVETYEASEVCRCTWLPASCAGGCALPGLLLNSACGVHTSCRRCMVWRSVVV